jgi:MoaA/NifB/PqqE/SkfB family radical SAM enzyme
MHDFYNALRNKFFRPDLDWIQVEITTRCNAECTYCPHGFFKSTKNMSLDVFRKITPCLKKTGLIYLQGWGEPLMNENIFEMVKICKMKDRQVGFTSNGMLLNEDTIKELVDLKLDILCVSLAGTSSDTHNRLRKGNDFNKIISNLLLLRDIKEKYNSELPRLHLAYIMLQSNFEEIRNIVSVAGMLDAKQVVGSNLSLIVRKNLYSEALYNNNNCEYYDCVLREIKEEALSKNIIFDYRNPFLLDSFQKCSENISFSSVVDVEGNISPCVFTVPSLFKNMKCTDNKIPVHYFKDEACYVNEVGFGNIKRENFFKIWNKRRYADFRKFNSSSGKAVNYSSTSDLTGPCTKCYKGLSA